MNEQDQQTARAAEQELEPQPKYSPLPWHGAVNDPTAIVAADGARVADCAIAIGMSDEEMEANAKLIVDATRAHSALAAENDRLKVALRRMLAAFSPFPRADTEGYREEVEACDEARAALGESK